MCVLGAHDEGQETLEDLEDPSTGLRMIRAAYFWGREANRPLTRPLSNRRAAQTSLTRVMGNHSPAFSHGAGASPSLKFRLLLRA